MDSQSCLRTNPPKQLTVPETALYLGVSERTIRNLVYERRIPHYRIGQRIIFRLVAIDRWSEDKEKRETLHQPLKGGR